MSFKKFLHIENLSSYEDKYVITEKIDGANIQFVFSNNNLEMIASRNQSIGDSDFNGYKEVIQQEIFVELFERLKKISETKTINLYGEIFGNKIQKNIPYGKTDIKFFAMAIDGEYMSFKTFSDIINNQDLIVPIISYTNSIEEIFNFDIENFYSKIAENSIAEGIIIQPLLYWDEKRIFKFKSENFKEKHYSPLKRLDIGNFEKFDNYLTEQRLSNVLSHYDKSTLIDKKSKVEVLKDFIEDAKKDYLKDIDLSNCEKSDIKNIFKYDFNKYYQLLENYLKG